MLSKQLNKASGEQVTIVVKNSESATITTGVGVALCNAATSIDGVSVYTQPVTTLSKTFVGIAKQDIPVNGYGNVVVWGLADSILLSHAGTSITITKGDVLWPSGLAGAFYSTGTDATNASTLTAAEVLAKKSFMIATTTATVSAAAYVSGIVRAL